MMYKPYGINPALVTPFKKNEDIDESGFATLIESVLPYVDGIVPCGTTGEFVYLSMEERKRIYELAVDEVGGKKHVIAGTGACSTAQAIELTAHASRVGATAALVVGPYYLTPSDKGFYQHFRDVADSTSLPIIMYNIPQVTGSYLPRRVIEDLSEIDNIVGLKDSSGNLTYTMEILDKVRDKINVMIGHDEVVLPALAGGCSGMILASAQVFPDIWKRVYEAVNQGDLATARKLQMKVQKLTRIYCRLGGAVPVKASLRMMGIPVGRSRKPLMEGGAILHEDLAEIRMELEKIGKLKGSEKVIEKKWHPLAERFGDIDLGKEQILGEDLSVATSTAGDGYDKIDVDIVAGRKEGIMGNVFAYQLTYPRHGFEALTTILEPNLAIRPSTLVIPTLKQRNLRQANMIFGPVQSSSAKAIADGIESGLITDNIMEEYLIIAKVFLHPDAMDRKCVYRNSYNAFTAALKDLFATGEGGD